MKKIYKCSLCGNVVELLHDGGAELICCGKPMELLQEKTNDAGMEKHVPVSEKTKKGTKIKIGAVEHPMEENHYIEWIEINFDGKSGKKFLQPGESPEANFEAAPENFTARCYCNVHGLWKN